MKNVFLFSKKNREIVLTNLIVLTILLFGLFFMVLNGSNYNNEKVYLYSFLFQLLTYSILISMWEVKGLNIVDVLFQIFIFTICVIPHLVLVGIANNINGFQLLLPLCIEYIWGISIISFKSLLCIKIKQEFTIHLVLKVFIFAVMIISLVFLSFYYHYENLVLTTIFDKRIPIVFFLNPLLNIAGIISTQLGEANYLGYKPVYTFVIFWIGILVLSFFIYKKSTVGDSCEDK